MLKIKSILRSYFPGLTIFEFINQYHLFLSVQPFPTSLNNCKIGFEGETENYIPIISWNIHHMYFVYSCILSIGIKNLIPVRRS